MVQRQKEIQIQKGHYEELNKKFKDIVIKRYGTLEQYMKAKSELENDKTLIDFIEDFYLDINLLNSKIKKINVKINNVTIKYDIPLNEKKKINEIRIEINDIENRIYKLENSMKNKRNLECLNPVLIKFSGMRKGFAYVKRELKYFDDFEKAHINPKNNKKIGKNDPNAHFDEMKYNCV